MEKFSAPNYGMEIQWENVSHAFSKVFWPPENFPSSARTCKSQYYGLTVVRLLSKTRANKIAIPRMVAMRLCREKGFSFHCIANHFPYPDGSDLH